MERRRLGSSTAVAIAAMVAGGCALTIVPKAQLAAPPVTSQGVVVFGKIAYVIDGETTLPYGAFRPSIQPPRLDLIQLESGAPFQSHGVNNDGIFVWRMRPGHYVISGIGQGQLGDDYRIPWPRLAFEVPDHGPVYLGHMKLRGERYAEPYTLSTGTTGTHRGIRYTFEVVDDRDPSTVTATERGVSSPVFHDPNMPIGEALAERWRQSREDLIREIFEP